MPDIDPNSGQPANAQNLKSANGITLSENSMRVVGENALIHQIDVKTRCQGIVLTATYSEIKRVQVKLISRDVIDQIYYDLEGEQLHRFLQKRYEEMAGQAGYNAIIPLALVGNLPLNDDSYIQITITLHESDFLHYDRIISAFDASNPLSVKNLKDVSEFDSLQFDEVFFYNYPSDVSYIHNGRRVHLPQLLFFNSFAQDNFSSLKLVANTVYNLSAPKDIFLVEY